MEKNQERNWPVVLLLMVLAMVLQAHMAWHNPNMSDDTLKRLIPFDSFFSGEGYFTVFRAAMLMPGYGFFSYIGYLLTGDAEYGAMAVSMVSFVLLVPVFFVATRLYFSRNTALLATTLMVVGPMFFFHGILSSTESVFTFFLLLGFVTHSKIVRDGPTRTLAVIHALTLSLAWLTRAEGFLPAVLSLLVILGMLAVHALREEGVWPEIDLKTAGKRIFLCFFVFVAVVGPWVITLRVQTGFWQIGQGNGGLPHMGRAYEEKYEIDAENNNRITPLQNHINYLKNNFEYVVDRTGKHAKVILKNILTRLQYAYTPLILLIILSLFYQTPPFFSAHLLSREKIWFVIAVALFISPVPVILLQYPLFRYYFPFSFFLLMLIAAMTVRAIDVIPISKPLLWAATLLILLVHLTLPLPGVPEKPGLTTYLQLRGLSRKGLRESGLWFSNNCQRNRKLRIAGIGSGNFFSFYARGKQMRPGKTSKMTFINMPNHGLDLKATAAKVAGGDVDYLVLDSYYKDIKDKRFFSPLWEQPHRASEFGLSLVRMDDRKTYQIYQALPTANNDTIEPICGKGRGPTDEQSFKRDGKAASSPG